MNFYSGLSGLVLPIPKSKFPAEYQEASRLTYYATFFNSIEFNSTFYKLPLASTIIKWGQQVPENFKFTFKLWKQITHNKNLEFTNENVAKFFNVIANAGPKKGCVLIQFPPSLGKFAFPQLDALLKCISLHNTKNEWSIAVEFRNKTWYDEDVYELLEKYSAALVIQDIPKSRTPMIDHSSSFIYIRFHGPSGNYRDSYDDAFLAEYATYIREWMEEGKTVFVYFNNTMGDAFKNLEMLNAYIR